MTCKGNFFLYQLNWNWSKIWLWTKVNSNREEEKFHRSSFAYSCNSRLAISFRRLNLEAGGNLSFYHVSDTLTVYICIFTYNQTVLETTHYHNWALWPVPLSGGFYSDTLGYVADGCKKCPNGSYVAFDKKPGKSILDCKTCPDGNNQAWGSQHQ